jgi:hypothetical protein
MPKYLLTVTENSGNHYKATLHLVADNFDTDSDDDCAGTQHEDFPVETARTTSWKFIISAQVEKTHTLFLGRNGLGRVTNEDQTVCSFGMGNIISRSHALAEIRPDGNLFVTDLGSKTGVYIKNINEPKGFQKVPTIIPGGFVLVPFVHNFVPRKFYLGNPTPLEAPTPVTPASSSSSPSGESSSEGGKRKRSNGNGNGSSNTRKPDGKGTSKYARRRSNKQAASKPTGNANSGSNSDAREIKQLRKEMESLKKNLKKRKEIEEKRIRQAKHQGQVQGRRQVKVKNKHRNQRNRQGHHPAQSKAHSRWKKVPKCRFYERDGNCKHGDNCQYFHDFTKFKEAQSTNLNKKRKSSKNRNANVRNGMNGKGNAGAARRRDQKRRRRN